MTRPMVNEVNLDKNINVTREMNDEEYAQYLIDQEAAKIELAKQAEEDAKIAAKKAAKAEALAALGLSQEVINLLAE
jgi:hypothetical protein